MRIDTIVAAILIGATGCKERAREVVVYTSVDQVFAEPILKRFEREQGIAVRAVFDTEETKSTGVLNRLIAEANAPQADVFWSGDPVRPFVLIERGLVEPHVSPAAKDLPAAFRDASGMWTGLAARARVLLVNTDRVPEAERPRSIRDLAAERWKGQTAIANPLFGTTTIHVASWFAQWGEEKARAFLDALKKNEIRVAGSNGEVKRLVVAGEVAFGLTDTDDAHEALASGARVAIIYPDQDTEGTLFMPTSVVLLRGGPHPAEARVLVDFLVSTSVEKEMTERGAHMPLRTPATGAGRYLDTDYAKVAAEAVRIQPWLRSWAGL